MGAERAGRAHQLGRALGSSRGARCRQRLLERLPERGSRLISQAMTQAFFVPDGADTYISTEWTRGPWSLDSQHAGPPSALLGRAVHTADERTDLRVARIAFDILRPVPIAPLTVGTRI